MINFSNNLTLVRKKSEKKQSEVADAIGISRSRYANYEGGHSTPDVSTLLKIAEYFKVSVDYLLGLKSNNLNADNKQLIVNEPSAAYGSAIPKVITVDSLGNENIVMVDVKAAAGYVTKFQEQNYFQNLPAFSLPGSQFHNATFRAFEIEGDSMFDTLYHGDWVICRRLDGFSDIRDGYIHVIVTFEEICVKRVLNRSKQRGKLVLQSDNEAYPAREIEADQVQEIWLVKSFMGFNMPNRRLEIKKVLNEIQAKLLENDSRLERLERKK